MHVVVIVDIAPAWVSFWKSNVTIFFDALFKELFFSVHAVIKHAVLGKAVNFLYEVFIVASSIF